jgi:hypothetical protein
MNKIIFFLFFLTFISCKQTNQNDIFVDEIQLPHTIEGVELSIPPILLNPTGLHIVDSFLIVPQSKTDSIFYLFHIPDCRYLVCFGTKGRGPNEFMTSFPSISLASIPTNDGSFAVDNKMNAIQYYRTNDILKRTYSPYKIEHLPDELNGFQQVRYAGDTLIIAAPYRGSMLLLKYNSDNKIIRLFKKYPKTFPFNDPELKRFIYACNITVRPDNLKFALSYTNFGIIEIYDINNNTPITISYNNFPPLEDNLGLTAESKMINHNENQRVFSWGITATKKYIYVKVLNDKYVNISDGRGLRKSFIPEIHIFDWQGKFILNIKLDKFYSYFDVGLDDKYLFAIDGDVPDAIRRYDLTNVLF